MRTSATAAAFVVTTGGARPVSPLTDPDMDGSAEDPSVTTMRSFDPLLDPRCHTVAKVAGRTWHAEWIWHPGQLVSHLQAKGVRAAMRRCTSVGYPGTLRQPLTHVYLRTRAVLEKPRALRWAGPVGRIRLLLNGSEGDITERARDAKAGLVEIFVAIDFAEGLPSIILEGGPLSSGPQWESSLDRDHWIPVESEPALSDPDLPPDASREVTVLIPPVRTARSNRVTSAGSAYLFQPGGNIVLDFQHDELGQLAFEASGKGKISIAVGESLAETENADEHYFDQYALPVIDLTSSQAPFLLPERCARFVRLTSTDECRLSAIRFKARVTQIEYRGHFHCSDPILNSIWAAGAATLHACLHDFYLDGIRRDALSWHDGLIAAEAGDLVFCDAIAARQTILSQSLPPNPAVRDLGIADAPLYGLTAFENDYLVRGDLEFSHRHRERIHDTLKFFMSLQDERGFVSGHDAEPYGFFPDWSATETTGPDSHGIPAYAQMLLMRAFEIGAAFAHRWREADAESIYSSIAAKLRSTIRKSFWSDSDSAYINGFTRDGKSDGRITSFAQVNAILFDLSSPQEWGHLFDRVLDNPSGRAANWSISQVWELLAYAKAGRIGSLLGRLRSIWGGILNQGYTRFWEDIRPADDANRQLALYGRPFANSLCHVWAGAAPVLALMRGLLGVWPTEAGYTQCDVRPQLAQLERVTGTVPTPRGGISIELERAKTGTLVLPAETSANLIGYVDESAKTRLTGPGTFRIRPVGA